MSNSLLYPAAPANVPASVTEVSNEFKQEVKRVITSIVLFFIVYVLLVIAAVLLSVACVFLGIQVIIAFPRFITLVFGLGLMGLGLSIVFFLIKFIFAVNKNDQSNLVEIKEKDQPALFAFIKQLSQDTHTHFPKKIFISPDVNASVFYHSSFWSMLLPVKKNLVIGAGLVNCVNISEFKAVIAHEFGHFSQRSMKLGSFTYNVNKIIYNMLYENNGFGNMLTRWGNLHGVISFFVGITIYIANTIIAILKKMYALINKSYMGLSRQMEFHADSIAAGVAGANNLVTALRRIEIASPCYNIALERAGEWLKKKEISSNIYSNQFSVLKAISNEYQLDLVNNLPVISNNFLNSLDSSRVNFEDQYASHPTRRDREVHLNSLNIEVAPDDESAWVIFNNAPEVQKKMTENIYSNVKDAHIYFDDSTFEEDYLSETKEVKLPEEYCGFYTGRIIIRFHIPEKCEAEQQANTNTFKHIFNEISANLPKQLKNNEADLQTLKAIADKHIDVKSFDFDGVKYSTTEATNVAVTLEKEIDELKDQILKQDLKAFNYLCSLSTPEDAETLKEKYNSLFNLNDYCTAYFDHANKVIETCNNFLQTRVTIEVAASASATLKANYEPGFKNYLREFLNRNFLNGQEQLVERVQKFIDNDYVYFADNAIQSDEVGELYSLTTTCGDALNNYRFKQYKKLLEFQLSLYKQAA